MRLALGAFRCFHFHTHPLAAKKSGVILISHYFNFSTATSKTRRGGRPGTGTRVTVRSRNDFEFDEREQVSDSQADFVALPCPACGESGGPKGGEVPLLSKVHYVEKVKPVAKQASLLASGRSVKSISFFSPPIAPISYLTPGRSRADFLFGVRELISSSALDVENSRSARYRYSTSHLTPSSASGRPEHRNETKRQTGVGKPAVAREASKQVI